MAKVNLGLELSVWSKKIAVVLLILECVWGVLPASGLAAEVLNRGMLAIPDGTTKIYLSWRLLKDDDSNIAFNVYRSSGGGTATKLNQAPIKAATCFVDDFSPPRNVVNSYWVRPVVNGVELAPSEQVSVPVNWVTVPYLSIPLQGAGATAYPGRVGIADLNGDGAYDYVVRVPDYNVDPAYPEPSPDTFKLQAYLRDGTFLWEHDLGWSIELGIWYAPYVVYDLDGDGCAEVAVKTGVGDPRDVDGRVTTGAEYVTILNGMTGAEITNTAWPTRDGLGEYVYYSRNQLGIAYLDGRNNNPSLIVARGTYGLMKVVAYQYYGGALHQKWSWSSTTTSYRGQGAHTMHCVDIDNDGKDEVILGSCVINDDGIGLWSTGLGHCDHCYVGDIDPNHPGLEIYYGLETSKTQNGVCLVDAGTGQIIWGLGTATSHVHNSGLCSDIDPSNAGMECYSKERNYQTAWLHSAGSTLMENESTLDWGLSPRAAYWDGDSQREMVFEEPSYPEYSFISKYPAWDIPLAYIEGTQMAWADILGDWREEIITSLYGEMRIYTTTIPASGGHVCLMQDPIYRSDVAHVSMGYNQPPMVSQCLQLKLSQTGYWKLDEESGTQVQDSSGNGNTGTVYGSPSRVTGVSGNALRFNSASDYVLIPAAVINPSVGSVGMWFKREAVVPDTLNYLFAHPGSNNSRIYLRYNSNDSTLRLLLGTGTTIGSYATIPGQWYYVVAVWEGTTAWFYVNGQLVNPSGTTFNGLSTASNALIASLNGSQPFNGTVDDVKIYNRALTAAEVNEEYLKFNQTGYWKLDEESGFLALDSSGRSNTGTIYGSPSRVNGISGSALHFDGNDDYVNFPASVINLSAGTVGMWFKRESISGTASYLFSHLGTNDSRIYLRYDSNSSSLNFLLGTGTPIASYTTTLGQWYYVVAVWEGTTGWFYVNGQLVNPSGTTFNGLSAISNVSIGSLCGQYLFNGIIDDVKIYNRALSAVEVNAEYFKSSQTGYWKFDEGSGTLALDSSGRGNTGTIYGSPSRVNGISGNALHFDGTDDQVNLPSSAINLGAGSVGMWFNRESTSVTSSYLFSHPGSNNSRVYLRYDPSESNLKFIIGSGTLVGTYATTVGQWYYVMTVWEGTTCWFYVNGQLVNPGGTTFNGLSGTTDAFIGNLYQTGTYRFNGIVDDVKIYNRALSAVEVNAEYWKFSLTGYWKLDEGGGIQALDSSGNGNIGTVYGNELRVSGLSGNALYFDGINDIMCLPSSVINPSAGSVAMWFNREAIVPGVFNYIFAHPGSNNSRIYLRYDSNSSTLKLILGDASFSISYATITNSWYYIVVVWEGTTEWFYVNGQLVNPGGTTFNGLSYASDVSVGGANGAYMFKGVIEDVKIYKRALTAAEVNAEYLKLKP